MFFEPLRLWWSTFCGWSPQNCWTFWATCWAFVCTQDLSTWSTSCLTIMCSTCWSLCTVRREPTTWWGPWKGRAAQVRRPLHLPIWFDLGFRALTWVLVLFWHLQQRERRTSHSRRLPPPPRIQNPTPPLDPSTLWASPRSAPQQKPCPPSTPGGHPPQVTPTEMSWINRCLATPHSSAPTHFSSAHKCVYQALFSLIHGPLHTQWQQPGAPLQRSASSFLVCGTAPQFHHQPQPTGCQCTHTERSMGNYHSDLYFRNSYIVFEYFLNKYSILGTLVATTMAATPTSTRTPSSPSIPVWPMSRGSQPPSTILPTTAHLHRSVVLSNHFSQATMHILHIGQIKCVSLGCLY